MIETNDLQRKDYSNERAQNGLAAEAAIALSSRPEATDNNQTASGKPDVTPDRFPRDREWEGRNMAAILALRATDGLVNRTQDADAINTMYRDITPEQALQGLAMRFADMTPQQREDFDDLQRRRGDEQRWWAQRDPNGAITGFHFHPGRPDLLVRDGNSEIPLDSALTVRYHSNGTATAETSGMWNLWQRGSWTSRAGAPLTIHRQEPK